jgi:hypothetical protein
MFGDKGLDLFGGTQSRRDELTSKLFGEGRSGEGGRLLALREAMNQEKDPNGPAHKAYMEAQGKLAGSKDKAKIQREMDAVAKDLGDGSKDQLAALGNNLVAGTTNDADSKALMANWGKDTKNLKRQEMLASGMSQAFGKEAATGASISEMLEGNRANMDPEMQKLADKYQIAKGSGDTAAMRRLEKKASGIAMRMGVNSENEIKGGQRTLGEKIKSGLAGMMASTEDNVSKAFPAAVGDLQSAADSLQEAADAMNRQFGGTDMRPNGG